MNSCWPNLAGLILVTKSISMKTLTLLMFLSLTLNPLFAQYHTYSDLGNLYSQRVIETADGGFFLAAVENCYTPGSVAIEGCVFGIHLVKTNVIGDTLWTNRISYSTQYASNMRLFEKEGGGFTIFAVTNQSYSCNGIFVGLSGFVQIEIINVGADGSLISNVRIPDDCAINLVDVTRLDDDLYAVLSYYEDPISINNSIEGRLDIMDNNGMVVDQRNFYNEIFKGGHFVKGNPNELAFIYFENNEILKLKTYDLQLNLLEESTNADLGNSCFAQNYMNINAKLLGNGDIGVSCQDRFAELNNVQFFRFDDTLNLLSENSFTLVNPTNFIENDDSNILIASTNDQADTVTNTQINYFDSMGDSLYSVVINHPENERPEYIINLADDQFVIAGNTNCCNYDSIVGPGQSFLLLPDNKTTQEITVEEENSIKVFPNPTHSHIIFEVEDHNILNDDYQVSIFLTNGKRIERRSLSVSSTSIDLSQLPDGMYFYTLSNGKRLIEQGKVIKN